MNSSREAHSELDLCIQAASGTAGSEFAILFALKRDGSLIGKPGMRHLHLVGDVDAQKAPVASALAALAKRMPLNITDGFGAAIAGRPLSIRIVGRPRQTDT